MTTATSPYTTSLTRHEQIAEGTMAFHFVKPPGFEFRAGQSIDITLLDPPETDAEGNIRTFTIASAPFDAHLTIATRMRDTAFKRTLRDAAPGLSVKLEGPSGDFVLPRKAERPVVFLAGGIGITPFLSMVRQATHDNSPHQLCLFYSNRRPEDAPFLSALAEAAKQNPRFRFVPCMTQMEQSNQKWTGETGYIDKAMLTRHLSSLEKATYYLAGPPQMVKALRTMLTGAGVDEDNIRTDEFDGY